MRVRTGIASAGAVLALGLAAPALASADTFNVNTTDDLGASFDQTYCGTGETCSIRQALDMANRNEDHDTINVPAGHYVIGQQLENFNDVKVQGAGARTTIIDAAGQTKVFQLTSPDNQTAPPMEIADIQITGGAGGRGGAIDNTGIDLTLTRDTLQGNTASQGGAVATYNPGEGGVFTTLRVVDSTISGNSATDGGGIYNARADVTVIDSTISDNHAQFTQKSGRSQLIQVATRGGGIFTSTASANTHVKAFSSTIADNTAGTEGGNVYIEEGQSTSFARGVVAANAPFTLLSTIVSGGSAPLSGANCGGDDSPQTEGFNLFSDDTCGPPTGSDRSGDPQLKALADNGGQTDTRALTDGSPAIDQGDPECTDDKGTALTSDQRTVVRPQNDGCDIGAVEFAPPVPQTGQPTKITSTTATLNGNAANPDAKSGTADFQWGTTTDYGQTAGDDSGLAGANGKLLVSAVRFKTVAAGAGASGFSADLTGLQPGTTYHYRVVASNPDATRPGADVSFRTPDSPSAPPEPTPTPTPTPSNPHDPNVRASRLSGRCFRSHFTARIRVHVASTTKLRVVHVKLDGHSFATRTKASFVLRVNVARLRHGAHVLVIRATDRAGNTTTLRRNFTRCKARAAQPRFTG